MYSDGTYSVIISDAAKRNVATSGPHFISWQESGMHVHADIQGLQANTQYVVTIAVETLVGQSLTSLNFSEQFIISYCNNL